MKTTILTCNGKMPNLSSIKIPSWGGEETNNTFQPWHLQQFNCAANSGIELLFPHENVSFTQRCAEPFQHLSEKFYSLTIDLTLSTQTNHKLLIMPHYRYYTDNEWSTPLPVNSIHGTDWWPMPLTILFRYGHAITRFVKDEPFAQGMIVESTNLSINKMNDEELMQKKEFADHINKNKDKYVTRNSVMDNGVEQDNLYNVLAMLHSKNKLDEFLPKKKFKIIRRQNAQMEQTEKT